MSATSRTLRLVAPSGYCQNQAAARLGIERLRAQGHQIENSAVIERRFQRFAGDDQQRLNDINDLASLHELPDIVLAVRGGYGVSRLLDKVNYPALKQRLSGQPLAICGHSDFTALQLALLSRCGLISFSGPMLAGNFGAETLSPFTERHFWQAITTPQFTIDWTTDTPDCHASGTLWGGNLAMIASLVGTPWLPQFDDGILVIEDVNEHPFRTERMLLQLHQSGILARQRAIITGSFTGATLSEYDQGFDFSSVWNGICQLTGLPVITGLDFGHDYNTVTLPLGARATVQVSGGTSQLTLSGHPTLR
ncbi:muramoyltetrapeptide carboxypeptidase [Winslowiella iniecta]|uniref:Peptidase S66 n=1 Tax=Winslowiella iniecta TaxID=1560201 RepID=A0A0L7TIB9_9GAMM|nr:muramoyltetrapeptide carboxypeptidase [Winslowiella iniecta]KOC91975.1 peptidase S66 [Winslowiella iniecta]KOC95117.1 peptidase S66 [Winslowiella iniecta]